MRAESLGLRALGVALVACVAAQSALAQRKPSPVPPAPPALSDEAAAAYEELSPRFATEGGLIQGWYRDRTVMYYDFGAVKPAAQPAPIFWPIHGFDARGNPVAMRGQRPIFSTIPGLPEYSSVYRLTYVVVADNVQPNYIRDISTIDALVAQKKASLRESALLLNLPVVPRGARLARDSSSGLIGWYKARDIQFFDFGAVTMTPVGMWRFARGKDSDGVPVPLEGQNSIVDSIPVSGTFPDLWAIRWAMVDSAYVPNSLKSWTALRAAPVVIDTATTIRNLPITIIDGAPIARAPSPLRAFADLRSPFPPAFTRPQQ
jgi:hypothetical protein